MQVLIATAGVLPPDPVADLTEQLLGHYGSVTVITVIEVPHQFLETIRAEEWRPLAGGEAAWPSEQDALMARYVEERGRRLVEPVLAALRARGISAHSIFVDGSDPARSILGAAEDLDADVIVLGATRSIFDESSWESVSMRVIRKSPCPVLVIPPPSRVAVPHDG
ncbi:MAG: universal stress protein [Actinomycetota bacterium]|nr:universal stress protein [Actinomycetota bacterium]